MRMVWPARRLKTLPALILLAAGHAAAAAEPCRLAILGDSLTAGYGVAADSALPRQLEAALREAGSPCAVVDAGVSGDTTAGGATRLDWVLADRPTHLLVELGGNDGLRALPPAEVERNLADIVARAQAAGVEVMLAGMVAPPNLGADYGRAFAQVFPDVARSAGVPLYPFLLDGAVLHPDLMQADGIHPNAAGVREIVRRMIPSVSRWVSGGAPR